MIVFIISIAGDVIRNHWINKINKSKVKNSARKSLAVNGRNIKTFTINK